MTETKTVSSVSQFHVEVIDGARYEVTSTYNENISLLDLFKQMLKRDLERPED